jgi:hypothetical protein
MDGEDEPRAGGARGGEGVRPDDAGAGGPAEPAFVAPNKGRRLQARRVGRRKLFDAAARKVFLGWFAGTGNLSWAAKEAGVHYRTVLRHRMEDGGFREAYDLAEAQSLPRLRAWLAQAKEEEARRLAEGPDDDSEPGGNPAPENLSVEQAMRLVEAGEKRQGPMGSGPGQVGRGQGRGMGRIPTVASNAEVRDALVKRLRAFGIRTVAERRAGGNSGASAVTPPPWSGGQCPALSSDVRGTSRPDHSGWSPSPSKLGEDQS